MPRSPSSWDKQLSTDYVVTGEGRLDADPRRDRACAREDAGRRVRHDHSRGPGSCLRRRRAREPGSTRRPWTACCASTGRPARMPRSTRMGDDGAIVTEQVRGRPRPDGWRALPDDHAVGQAAATCGSPASTPGREFNPLELADVSISRGLFDRSFETRDDRLVFVKLDDRRRRRLEPRARAGARAVSRCDAQDER